MPWLNFNSKKDIEKKRNCDTEYHYKDGCMHAMNVINNSSVYIIVFSARYDMIHDMGLRARKPVFGGLRTTKVQTSLRIRAV